MVMSRKSVQNSTIGTLIIGIMIVIFVAGFGIMLLGEYHFYKNAEQVYGVVDEVDKHTSRSTKGKRKTTYTFYVSYTTLDNQSFSRIKPTYKNVNGAVCSRGDRILVAYDKDNPTKIGIGSYSSTANITFAVFVVIFGAAAVAIFIVTFKSNKKLKNIKYLMNNGIRGDAEITNISSSKSGRNTYYIVECAAHNPFNGQIMNTQSGKITSIKGLGINKHLNAYFDPNDPEIYFINLD